MAATNCDTISQFVKDNDEKRRFDESDLDVNHPKNGRCVKLMTFVGGCGLSKDSSWHYRNR